MSIEEGMLIQLSPVSKCFVLHKSIYVDYYLYLWECFSRVISGTRTLQRDNTTFNPWMREGYRNRIFPHLVSRNNPQRNAITAFGFQALFRKR